MGKRNVATHETAGVGVHGDVEGDVRVGESTPRNESTEAQFKRAMRTHTRVADGSEKAV